MRLIPLLTATLLLSPVAGAQSPAPSPRPVDPVEQPPEIVVVPAAEEVGWQEVKGVAGLPVTLANKSGKPVYWLLIDSSADTSLTPIHPDKDGKTPTAVFGGKLPGRYRVLAVGLVGSPARIAVTLSGALPPGPGPEPPPNPQPQPQPPPSGPVKKFVIVEDTLKAGPWRGELLGSPAFASLMQRDGLKRRIIDKNVPENADPEAQLFLAAAQGKELPYLWTFDDKAVQTFAGPCPKTVEEFMAKVTGEAPHKRAMGNRPPPARRYAWKQFGAEPKVPLIPRAEWKTTDLSAFLPPVYDQDGKGQCNASATCTAMEASRKMAGLTGVYLSAGDLYSQINDGRDQGSLLEDGLYAAMANGVASVKLVPYVWDGRNHGNDPAVKADRQLYVVLEAYECPNFDAMASAVQQGFFIIEGLMWFNNFDPDRDGWLPARGSGGGGGHALCGFGLAQRSGVWGIKTRNSWSPSWGKAGNCIIPESLFGQQIGGFWAVRAMRQTGTDFPVTPKVTARVDPFADKSRELAAFSHLPPVLKP